MKLNALILALCAGMVCGNAAAQDFDLSSQRQEIQQFLPVDGEKINHNGLVINPTPHDIFLDEGETLNIVGGIKVNDRNGRFADVVHFIHSTENVFNLTIDFGENVSEKA